MKKCDIIIPIYNAYDCVKDCIDSVLKNTIFNGNNLILINDKSTDKRIDTLLKEYEKKNEQIIYLSNEENLGFVGTVNKGMNFSKNDVVLLNSDTEVTNDWLIKIQKCAYSSSNIATVTPLSNNATLASVPIPFEANDIPKGYSLSEMADLVEKCSLNHYPEIPTGHGFCLFIKRDVLDKVGLFDQETYGKGYGEENDFCFRCYEFGYKHVLCDNTYILHKESKSFLDSKEELIKQGLKELESRYPYYKHQLDLWIQERPLDYIASNIVLSLNMKKRPNILFIIHDWTNFKKNLGGTTLHAWDLIKNMRDKYNFHVFAPENGIFKVYSYFENDEMEIKYSSISGKMTYLDYYNGEYKRLLNEIIETYGISFVHIHHIIGHYFDMIDVFKKKSLKYMITLHDFYCMCPLINKLYNWQSYCDFCPKEELCNNCLKESYGTNIDISVWRNEWKRILANAEYVITPSEATRKEVNAIYQDIDIKVIEHGIDIEKSKSNLELNDKVNDFAFIGAIGVHKGSKILDNLIRYYPVKNSKLHLFGKANSQFCKDNKYFKHHGIYQREELKELLNKNNVKLICLFSIWPETYSYTLTEAIACGIPVVSFDFGAIAERIKKYNLGWIIDSKTSPKDISKEIEKILSNKDGYEKVIKSINKYKIITSKEMASNYVDLYGKNSVSAELDNNKLGDKLLNNRVLTTNVTYSDYSWVFNTLKWRLISKIKIPKFIKRAYRTIRKRK